MGADPNELKDEIIKLQQRIIVLEKLAATDPLTGLNNRRAFFSEIDRAIGCRIRYGHSAAVIFLDVDRFKAVNDRHGHQVGDATLVFIAESLDSMVRSIDCVARLGGDEFGILLGHISEKDALAKGECIARSLCQRALGMTGIAHDIAISWGLAMVKAEDSPEAVIERADRAMFLHKASERP